MHGYGRYNNTGNKAQCDGWRIRKRLSIGTSQMEELRKIPHKGVYEPFGEAEASATKQSLIAHGGRGGNW
jgi:hypothetical protein